jgi:hypothetical protein
MRAKSHEKTFLLILFIIFAHVKNVIFLLFLPKQLLLLLAFDFHLLLCVPFFLHCVYYCFFLGNGSRSEWISDALSMSGETRMCIRDRANECKVLVSLHGAVLPKTPQSAIGYRMAGHGRGGGGFAVRGGAAARKERRWTEGWTDEVVLFE